MVESVFNIKNCFTFENSFKKSVLLMHLIVNKPFRRAFGSILEGRFSFYKAVNSFVSL